MTKHQDEGTPQPDGNVHFNKKEHPDHSNKDHDKNDKDAQPDQDGELQPDGNVHFKDKGK